MTKRQNYDKIVQSIRYVLATLSAAPLAVFFASLLTNPNFFVGSDIFVIYFTVLCFTLPSLVAKVLLKKDFLGLHTVLTFLIYPAIYLFALFFANILNTNVVAVINVFGVLFLFGWHALAIKYILHSDFEHIDEAVTGFVLSLVPFAIFLFFISFVRDYDTIISTDILVHKTVLNGMETIKQFSIMPSGYSNMFTDQGYPVVFYHTFLLFINDAFNLSFVKVAYYIDFIFTLFASITLYKVFLKYFKSYGWAILATTLTILSFENVAYTTQYFIPQTMMFWFFLQIISNKTLKLIELIIAAPILVVAHFFMGTYFALILIFKTLVIDGEQILLKVKIERSKLLKILLCILLFVILLSFAGFSVEKTFQASTLKEIGIVSNPVFFDKFSTISNIYGLNILLVIPVLILAFKEKLKSKKVVFAFSAILLALIMYFLAPTFAAKFFLGLGFFVMIIFITFLKEIDFRKRIFKYLLALCLVLSFGINFIQQYYNLLPFLTQEDGTVSAVTTKDKHLIDYWALNKPNCVVISDPQTQIELHSFGEGNSVRGYYMTLESRKKLSDFIRNPTSINLNELYNLIELSDKKVPLCVAVSSRLNDLIFDNYAWLDVIYNYKVDQGEKLADDDKAVKYLKDSGFKELYSDSYTRIFQIR